MYLLKLEKELPTNYVKPKTNSKSNSELDIIQIPKY